jgi:hypothetical protein
MLFLNMVCLTVALAYSEYYQPQVLTSLDDLYCSNMINSMRDYTPSFAKNIRWIFDGSKMDGHPLCVLRPGRAWPGGIRPPEGRRVWGKSTNF